MKQKMNIISHVTYIELAEILGLCENVVKPLATEDVKK